MRTIILSYLLLIAFYCNAQQWRIAKLNENNIISVTNVEAAIQTSHSNKSFSQLSGFPIGVVANASFKNMRNVALADINGDSISDIIFATNNTIYAYSYQGLLWQKSLIGVAIYPPSIGDVNGDGQVEIVQVTGGSPSNGRIYVFDINGNTLAGWPLNFNDNWILTSPVLSDVNYDGSMEIIVSERTYPIGRIHILKHDASSYSNDWPVTLNGTPAVTPSVADVDNDGQKDIVVCSTTSRYIFGLDGQPKLGFPNVTEPFQKYSYQSPIIADLDNDNNCEIIGATHGDIPHFYVTNNDGSDYTNWPLIVPDNSWTYSTPTVVKINASWNIFMSRPIGASIDDMLYGWDDLGNLLPNFPILKSGGLEGYISIADVDNDSEFELVFGSNMTDTSGYGFIHAYNMDGSGEVSGFPIRPYGWTFMNGVCIGDINGDSIMDITALSYTNTFGASTDSTFINVYNLNTPYSPNKVLWSTYKGDNTRVGYVGDIQTQVLNNNTINKELVISPNPVGKNMNIKFNMPYKGNVYIYVYDNLGKSVMKKNIGTFLKGKQEFKTNTNNIKQGFYTLIIYSDNKIIGTAKFVK